MVVPAAILVESKRTMLIHAEIGLPRLDDQADRASPERFAEWSG
jgi:hypothetical protein